MNTQLFLRVSKLGGLVGSIIALCGLYLLLLGPSHTIFSIATLNAFLIDAPNWEARLVIFLMPLYFSVVLFGCSFFGWRLGCGMCRLLHHVTIR